MEVFAPSPAELLRLYGAKKTADEKYEVSALNLPWVFRRELEFEVAPGPGYVVDGVKVDGLYPPWEAYVALIDVSGEFGVGYIVAKRRRMFSCVHKGYSKPIDVQLAPHITIRPVELILTDREGVISCIDRAFRARYVAVFVNAPIQLIKNLRVVLQPIVRDNV